MWQKAAVGVGVLLAGMTVLTAVVPTAARPPRIDGRGIERIEERRERTQTFRGAAARTLSINARAATVRVITGNSDALVVRLIRTVKAETRPGAMRALDQLNERSEVKNGGVLITDVWPQSEQIGPKNEALIVSLEILVEAPRGVKVVASQRAGTIELRGSVGEIDLKLQTGNVLLAQLDGTHGKVSVSAGHFGLNGKIGNLDVVMASGSVQASKVDARLADRLSIKTGSGAVSLALDALPKKTLTTLSGTGNVELTLPRSAPGSVRLASEIGTVRASFPLAIVPSLMRHAGRELSGVLNQTPRPTIQALSSIGNVTLAQSKT